MTTYAKYADMYRQRLARSQDARLELSGHVSPARSHSALKATNQTTIASMANQQMQMQNPNTIHSMHSPRSASLRPNQQLPQRQTIGGTEIPPHVKMAQDRSAYMTFLEVQLERVTQACTNALSFQDKVEAIQIQVNGQDEKVQNIGRLVKLLQSYSEAQEEDVSTIKVQMRNMAIRIDEGLRAQSSTDMAQQNYEQYDGGAFGAPKSSHANSVSPTRSKRSLSKSRSPAARRSDKKPIMMGERVGRLESQLKSIIQGGGGSLNQHFNSNSFGTLEAAKIPNINQMKDDLNNFATEVDRQMRDVEARIVTNLSQHIEESSNFTNIKVDEALLLLDEKVQRLQQMNTASFQRQNVINSTQIIEDGRINPAKMESALNDWLSKVEEQVNQIEELSQTRAAQIDMKSLERRVIDLMEEKEVRFAQLEQYCQRMCDQGNTRYDQVQEQSLDWEDRFLQIQKHVESTLDVANRSINDGVGRGGSLLTSVLTSSQLENQPPGHDLSSVRVLEKKLARRLGEGIERLGGIIKDLVKEQRKLDSRTGNLELKVFGQVKNKDAVVKKKVIATKVSQKDLVQSQRSNRANSKPKGTVQLKTVKSPVHKVKAFGSRRRSQRSFSPPVKDASPAPVEKRLNSSQRRRTRSKSSVNMRNNSNGPKALGERSNSASARQHVGALNNFKTSFEQRLLGQSAQEEEQPSPRELLRRARDRSVRELSQSMHDSRSPHSHRIQSLVDIEQASPHQHHRLSQSIIQQDSTLMTGQPDISISHAPVNIVANPNMTQVIGGAAHRDLEMEQFKQRGSSGLNTGREYQTYPGGEAGGLIEPRGNNQRPIRKLQSKNSAKRSSKGRKSSRDARSGSRDQSKDYGSAFTLQELEKREKSLQKKLASKRDQQEAETRRGRFNTSRNAKNNMPAEKKSKSRSLSQRTFAKMNVIGHNTQMAAARGSANLQQRPNNHDVSYNSINNQSFKKAKKTKQGDQIQIKTLSPQRNAGQIKTTKSALPRHQTRSISAQARDRSRSANALSQNSEPRQKQGVARAPSNQKVSQTAAQEIFQSPFDYHNSSNSQIGTFNSRRQSENSARQQQPKTSAKRKRSISMEHSREEKKSLNATADNLGKKRTSLAKQGISTPASSKKLVKAAKSPTVAASKTAKQKLKNLQNKKSNQRLAKLEKMYQELTEIEAKTATQI